ncbi:MAG: T9SS type A sorting domain-containing protein [Saprospiraceae bacterium]|nr:T9SS type A sorting domain-containing protein [Saprospiraceae bacterium]
MKRIHILTIVIGVLFHLPFTASAIIEITSVKHITTGFCDGEIDLTAEGPPGNGIYPCTFEWTLPDGTTTDQEDLINLCEPGVYVVKITFADGSCNTSLSVTLVKCSLAFQPQQTIKDECPGLGNGSILITPSPGGTAPFVYNWSNGASTQNLLNLSSGQYCLTITDMYGCNSKPECYEIEAFDPLTSIGIESYPESPNCNGGFGTINITFPIPGQYAGPYDYLWSTGETTQLNLYVENSDYYSVTVTDGCGNSVVAGTNYYIYRPLDVELSLSNFCSLPADINPFASSGGGGPYSYLWSNGSTNMDITVNIPGTYTVTITSAQGCSGTQSISAPINQDIEFDATIINPSFGSCNDGSISLNLSGGQEPFHFSWSGPGGFHSNSQNIIGIPSGIYCVTVTDDFECSTTRCFTLVQNTFVTIGNITNVTSCSTNTPDCSGNVWSSNNGSISLIKSGPTPLSFVWSNGSTTMNITNLPQGQYTVTITSTNGCTQTITANICCCYPSAPNTFPSCLSPCYLPANQAPPAINLVVSNFNAPQTNSSKDGSIDILVNGGFGNLNYLWSGPNGFISSNQNISGIGPGLYCVTVTNGCSSTSTCVQMYPCSSMNLSASTNFTCPQLNNPIGKVNLSINGGNPFYFYSWSNGSSFEDLNNMLGGVYTVTVTDIGGCQKTLSATIANNSASTVPRITENDCYFERRCGSHVEIEQAATFEGEFTSCNTYTKFCEIGPTPMREVVIDINQPITWNQVPNFKIFTKADCSLNCLDGSGYSGSFIINQIVDLNLGSQQCTYGDACLFTNILLDGTHYPSYLIPTNVTKTNLVVNSYSTEDPSCPGCCLLTYSCGPLTETICKCGVPNPCFALKESNNEPDSLEISLHEFVDATIKSNSVDEVGVHKDANPDMSIREYENLISSKMEYPVLPFSQILLSYNDIYIYPNPFNDVLQIIWKRDLDITELSLFNGLGQLIHNEKYLTNASLNKIEFRTQHLSPGIYQISCRLTNGIIIMKKLIKI